MGFSGSKCLQCAEGRGINEYSKECVPCACPTVENK